MTIFGLITLLFSAPSVPKDTFGRAHERTHRLVASRSHGNIRLQSGEFYTKRDVDVKYDRYKNVRFATGA